MRALAIWDLMQSTLTYTKPLLHLTVVVARADGEVVIVATDCVVDVADDSKSTQLRSNSDSRVR